MRFQSVCYYCILLIWSSLLVGCSSKSQQQEASKQLPAAALSIPSHFPNPTYPKDNVPTADRIALGKRLFFDPLLSRDSTISCASCHKQQFAFADNKSISPGVKGRLGERNAPSLFNLAWLTKVNKDGGVPKLDLQAMVPIEDHEEMDFTGPGIAKRLLQDSSYRVQFQQAYQREPSSYTISRALASFGRSLISAHSNYDYFVLGDSSALSTEAQRGMRLFFSNRLPCQQCHGGFNFTNNSFANNGLYEHYDDEGRWRITLDSTDLGKFRVPSLRNVALTAPYMHNGSLSTLEEVIEHYNSGGKAHPNKSPLLRPLQLSKEEKSDLIAFLESTTDVTGNY